VSVPNTEPPPRLTAADYLAAAPDAFGDVEIVDGLIVRNMAQSELRYVVRAVHRRGLTVVFEDLQRP
jgi:hypothetical protein